MGTQSPLFLSSSLLVLIVTFYNLHTTTVAVRSAGAGNSDSTSFIRTSCGITLYPDLCVSSLSSYKNAIQHNHAILARAAVTVSLARAQTMASYVSNLLRRANSDDTTSALRDCSYSLGVAVDNIRGSLKEMERMSDKNAVNGEKFRFQMSCVQTWMSTAMTEQQSCSQRFDAVRDGSVKTDVRGRVTEVKKFISNALALVQSYGNNVRKP
ncbi:pectinesterase inhibitor 9-like [Prosopis cineraria]|uniref:pectinesterase inhibitor 9-like n=1 Tax=Prosopis cineraria TaxID=364024 RepID=UPI0024103003|nr:pectinesterase inhibitor 9-like [Prosopis cineraria]